MWPAPRQSFAMQQMPGQVVKGFKNDSMEGQSSSCGRFSFLPGSVISQCIDAVAEGKEMCSPVCYMCHWCAINESTARQKANLIAVKYPAHLSVCKVNSHDALERWALDKTHDLEDSRNEVRAAKSQIVQKRLSS